MASNSYPLWIGLRLLLEEDRRRRIIWMFLPRVDISQIITVTAQRRAPWTGNGENVVTHPVDLRIDTHFEKALGKTTASRCTWVPGGYRGVEAFLKKSFLSDDCQTNTGFASQHPNIHLSSAFREWGAADCGSTGRLDTEEEGRKNGNYHFWAVRKWRRA